MRLSPSLEPNHKDSTAHTGIFWTLGTHFSSQHHTFKVVPYNEATNDEWRLATVDDVLDSLYEAKNSMDGNEYYLCSLQDGYIGGRGFKYNISGDFKKQEHRLLVKGKTSSCCRPPSCCGCRGCHCSVTVRTLH